MINTTYYNLNIVEGSDIVNPLTVDNPNYQTIDETMHDNAISGVTLATEISNGTVHAITRENSECAVIRFIATSKWKAGDTATVDGVPVTALLPSGETLPDGAYVINTNVLCILTGTNMTVFAERKNTDNANDIKYKATNVGAELDKVNIKLNEIGTIYEATGLTGLHAPQSVGMFGQLFLPKGSYVVSGSAKMATKDGFSTISIYVDGIAYGETNLFGFKPFDGNRATCVALINLDTDKMIYFGAWAESDFELTPLYLKAIKVK